MDQNISKNYIVDVGDTDAISEGIQKQKVNKLAWILKESLRTFLRSTLCFVLNICRDPLNCQVTYVWLKFQNVIRELDSRKPQLDDLIAMFETLKSDSNRQKLQSRGMVQWFFLVY